MEENKNNQQQQNQLKDAAITFETTYFDNHVGAQKQTTPVKQEFLPNFQDIDRKSVV